MLRAAGQRRGSSRSAPQGQGGTGSAGIVVQAVLLTVMVMTIGLLAVISRVASSRDASAASSLQAAARQAAEFGFSEIVAEMNRDRNSYTWITCSNSWSSVSDADLTTNRVYLDPQGRSTITTSASLPGSSDLSYSLDSYVPPPSSPGTSPTNYCSGNTFGNLKGGSGTFTIVGTAKRASGDVTTYTLKRAVSVGPAISPFQQSVLSNSGTLPPVDANRYGVFPGDFTLSPAPTISITGLNLTCTASATTGATTYDCTGLDNNGNTQSFVFDNSNQRKFPFTTGSSVPAGFCSDTNPIKCRLSGLTLSPSATNNNLHLIVTATDSRPVELFIDGTLNLPTNTRLCSHASTAAATTCATGTSGASGDWQALRIYGQATGTCPTSAATVQLNALTSANAPTADVGKPNLQGAFLWFPVGRLGVGGTITAAQADLSGWVCAGPIVAGASTQRIWPERIFQAKIFRGYGSRDLPAS